MERRNTRPPDIGRPVEGSQRSQQSELTSEALDDLVDGQMRSKDTGNLVSRFPSDRDTYEEEMKRRCGLTVSTKMPENKASSRNMICSQDRPSKRIQVFEKGNSFKKRNVQVRDKYKGKSIKQSPVENELTVQGLSGKSFCQYDTNISERENSSYRQRDSGNITSNGQDQRNKKTNQFFKDAITISDLQYLAKQTPDDTVMIIQENHSKFTKLFSKSCLLEEESKLILKVMAKSCKAERSSQQLLDILCEFKDSQFISSVLRSLVAQLEIASKTDILINIAVLLQGFALHFPSSFSTIFGLSSLIQVYADSVNDEQFLKEWGCFKELQDSMFKRQKKEKDKIRLQKERRLRPQDDFRDLSPFPNIEDVDFSCRAFLRKNKKYGEYEDDDDYLDTQFRLLKEDFVQPLRDGIREYLEHQNNPKQRISIKVYTNVHVCNVEWSNDKILHKLKFEVRGKKIDNWEFNKRLIFGTLLCLSMDNFKTFLLATVGDSDRKALENGYVNVEFQTRYEDVDSISNTTMFTMLETPAYFEAYKHVLITLQKMKEVPFSDYIVHCKTECKKPRYLIDDNLDFEFLNRLPEGNKRKESRRETSELQSDSGPQDWPCKESLNLNEAQYDAFKEALTNEFCIVQGPPGTGKTYLGLKIAETLLANLDLWFKDDDGNSHPILLVCYTNHALDQFIEGVSKFPQAESVENLVRFGGRSKNPTVLKYNVRNRRDDLYKRNELRALRDHKNLLYRGLSTLQQNIAQCGWQIRELRMGIVHEDVLRPFMEHHFLTLIKRFDKRDTFPAILNWLCIGDLVRKSRPNKNKKREIPFKETAKNYFESNPNLLENKQKLFALRLDDLQPKDDKDEKVNKDDKTNPPEQEKARKFKKLSKKMKSQLLTEVVDKLQNGNAMTMKQYTNVRFIWKLNTQEKWSMYFYWLQQLQDFLYQRKKTDLKEHLSKFDDKVEEYDEVTREVDYHILKKAKVIAMTTTGAAKNHDLLKKVNPRIVIIEEAAEVLESHTVSTLHPGCEHLILIGDHKQLKPNPNVYELANRYNLDLSMFERMVTNEHHPNTLSLQHRMRPSISRLMRHIYTTLEDHPSVEEYPDVQGIGKNLFFINHHEKEKDGEDSLSHANDFEASYLARLCKYLLLQGYTPSQITVLSTYLAQVGCIKKLLQNMFKERNLKEEIHVTAVDNYQGEENDIILLSLVRSNDEDIVGFLKIENRICVALSRAKIGMYVIGNFEALQKRSELWKELIKDVRESGEFGEALPLYCQNHIADGGIMATRAQDFDKAPEGGCTKKCEFRLNCGHVCHLKCHPRDKEHIQYKCLKPCLKKCERGHSCRNKCYEDCNRCDVIITKEVPSCGHLQDGQCHLPPEDEHCMNPCERKCKNGHPCTNKCHEECNQCMVVIEKTLPRCNHKQNGPCYRNPEVEKCMHPCEKKCFREHRCKNLCHEKCSPCTETISKTIPGCGHTQDGPCHLPPVKEKCRNPCEKKCENDHPCTNLCHEKCSACLVVIEKILPKCNHAQQGPCHVKAKYEKCLHPCRKSCPDGHSCKKLCHEDCGKCMVNVKKTLSCGHVVSAYCYESPSTIKCKKQCVKTCRSGHRCAKMCHERCGECPVEVEKVLPRCGHRQVIMCSDIPFDVKCRTPCDNILSCGHTCRKLCREPCECKVFSLKRLRCGHDGRIPCGNKTKKDPDCNVPCKATLICGHECKGSCKKCLGGRLHARCQEKHECRLLCGHTSQVYSDGSWTSFCTKKCDFRCEHGSCKRKCMERCTVMDCCVVQSNVRCNKRCEGDHRCVGLLDYPCPDFCKYCKPEKYQETVLGKRIHQAEIYMQLKCNHIFPVSFLDYWVENVPNQYGVNVVGYKQCIYCSDPIKACIRYYQTVKQTKIDIDKIVRKVFQGRDNQGSDVDHDKSLRTMEYLYKRLKKVRNFLKEFCSKEHHTREMAVVRKGIKFLQVWLKKAFSNTSQEQRDVEKEITRLQLLVLLLWLIDSNDSGQNTRPEKVRYLAQDINGNDHETVYDRQRYMAHGDHDDLNFNDEEHIDNDDNELYDDHAYVGAGHINERRNRGHFIPNNRDNFDDHDNMGHFRDDLEKDDDETDNETDDETNDETDDETDGDKETWLNTEEMDAVRNAVRLLLRHGPLLPDVFHRVKKLITTLPGMANWEVEEVKIDDSLKPTPLVFGCWFKCREGHLFLEGDPFNIPNPETVSCKECLDLHQ